MASLLKRLGLTLEMIKFEHSVFALPFAGTGALLALRQSGYATAGLASKLLWIAAAMVGARSAAMAFNRLLDADIDARNPRTRSRHLPAGLLSKTFTWFFVAASALVFLLAARALNPLCFRLAPAALALVFFYSYTKRFTTFSHLILGLSLGVSPAADDPTLASMKTSRLASKSCLKTGRSPKMDAVARQPAPVMNRAWLMALRCSSGIPYTNRSRYWGASWGFSYQTG